LFVLSGIVGESGSAAQGVMASEGQWDFLPFSGGQTLSYEIYDTFPPIIIRCPSERHRLELMFFVEGPTELATVTLERAGGDVRIRTRFDRNEGHSFGYAVASLPMSDPAVRALGFEHVPLVFRAEDGRRFGFPFDTSIIRIVRDCG